MPTDKFYTICAQGLRSATLGQYGPGFTADALRSNLAAQAKSFDTNWGPASNSPFTMVDPGVDVMNSYIDTACAKYQAWIDAGSPAVTD